MISKINSYSLAIKSSKSGLPVPVVNKAYLHSIYNPIKEAEGFARKYHHVIATENCFIVLGLAFGYHINALVDQLEKRGSNYYRVIVIEPNLNIFKECTDRKLLKNAKNVTVFSGKKIDDLYSSYDLVHAMMSKPALLPHVASYHLYLSYFKHFMNYQAGSKLRDLSDSIQDQKIRDFFMERNPNMNLMGLSSEIKKGNGLTREEMLLGAFFATCSREDNIGL